MYFSGYKQIKMSLKETLAIGTVEQIEKRVFIGMKIQFNLFTLILVT